MMKRSSTAPSAVITAWNQRVTIAVRVIENGSVEATHGQLKRGLRDALELWGSKDFPDLAAYQVFLQDFVMRKNANRHSAIALERTALERLPVHKTTDFSTATVTVTRSETISVRNVLYIYGALSPRRLPVEGARL